MKDLKYLIAYLVPILTIFGLYARGIFSFSTAALVFFVIPIIELVYTGSRDNLESTDAELKSGKRYFDYLLYLNVPLVYGILIYFLYTIKNFEITGFEITGLVIAVGITLGSAGINVAHELGHREERYNKFLSKMLLLPSMYCHFIIEHNLGHHKNVGTDEDPASAKRNEMIYAFWIRSVTGTYANAWKIEGKRLTSNGLKFYSIHNQMIIFLMLQLLLLAAITIYGGLGMLIIYLICACISVLLLETINYIEHYGLRRKKMENGRYERVEALHSWNSNHSLGRIFLYELTRHSDHHYLANKKYQVLDHHDSSKQLPFGYPMSILLSLIPPIWFKLMNPRL